MKFHTHIDPIRQRVNLYCEIGEEDGVRVFITRGGRDPLYESSDLIHKVAPGQEPPLWDWFPLEVVTELTEALNPRPAATERHLDDAIVVRDRLLTIVEERS